MDPAILSTYFARLLSGLPDHSGRDRSHFLRPVMHTLEVLEALNSSGHFYVGNVKQILRKVETTTHSRPWSNGGSSTSGSQTGKERGSFPPVLESIVELVLAHLNNGRSSVSGSNHIV